MNYYQILEIDKYSSTKEIKKHYYKLSKKYHPDKNNGISDENFKYLSEAYSVLSNPKKRYLYDLKLLLQENLGENFIVHFSDIELEILNDYYLQLTKTTEFKFLKLLFHSLPNHIKTKLKQKFKTKINQQSLIHIQEIKYIFAQKLNENYEIHFNRSLTDVYLNRCKEIILFTKYKTYHLFITHSDYSFQVYNNSKSKLIIHIKTTLPNQYSLNGSDLYYDHRINLYEYYFKDIFPIIMPNNFCIQLKNSSEFNNSIKIPNLGLKQINNQRGNLYIYKNLDLSIPIHHKNKYKDILKEIFN